jgi:hypothetical protein
MPEKKQATSRGKRRATSETKSPAPAADRSERPPESAEDFQHVLRRLIVARDRRSDGTRDKAE